jgi:hypothetical protein
VYEMVLFRLIIKQGGCCLCFVNGCIDRLSMVRISYNIVNNKLKNSEVRVSWPGHPRISKKKKKVKKFNIITVVLRCNPCAIIPSQINK